MACDPKYQALYKQLHNKGKYDGKARFVSQFTELVKETKSQSMLDYGCGKGLHYTEGKVHLENDWGFTPTLYDPAVPGIDKLPEEKFDIVYTTEVLEHIPESHIDQTLDYIFSHANKLIFMSACLCLAVKKLPNGENAHCLVKSPKWWEEKLDHYVKKYQTKEKGVQVHLILTKKNDIINQLIVR